MKKVIVSILITFICFTSLLAQNKDEPKLTKAEILQAQQLAARFYNRLAQTQDVAPLIKGFFIRDFPQKFKANLSGDTKITHKITSEDLQKSYNSFINYFYLYLTTFRHIEIITGNHSEKKANELINSELSKLLKPISQLLKFSNFNYEKVVAAFDRLNSLKSLRKEISRIEEFNQALRKIELKFRNEVIKADPQKGLALAPTEFEVSIDFGAYKSFNYPKRTRFFNVYEDKTYMNFLLVKQSGKMKIVMFIPNLD